MTELRASRVNSRTCTHTFKCPRGHVELHQALEQGVAGGSSQHPQYAMASPLNSTETWREGTTSVPIQVLMGTHITLGFISISQWKERLPPCSIVCKAPGLLPRCVCMCACVCWVNFLLSLEGRKKKKSKHLLYSRTSQHLVHLEHVGILCVCAWFVW